MKITDETTAWQIAELMGQEADELDGHIMLGILSRECIVDTDKIPESGWLAMIDEAQTIRGWESGDA